MVIVKIVIKTEERRLNKKVTMLGLIGRGNGQTMRRKFEISIKETGTQTNLKVIRKGSERFIEGEAGGKIWIAIEDIETSTSKESQMGIRKLGLGDSQHRGYNWPPRGREPRARRERNTLICRIAIDIYILY